MPVRSSTSEYQKAPPVNRLGGRGRVRRSVTLVTPTNPSNGNTKPNSGGVNPIKVSPRIN